MFDSNATIGITIPSPDRTKRLIVRYPSDAEWVTWRQRKKIFQRRLKDGSFEIEPEQSVRGDLALVNAIKLEGTQVLLAKAARIVDHLKACKVVECPQRVGSVYRIEMQILNTLTTVHAVRYPDMREVEEYQRNFMSVVFSNYGRRQTITGRYEAGQALYERLIAATEGYVGAVPIVQKAEIANVLVQLVRRESDGLISN